MSPFSSLARRVVVMLGLKIGFELDSFIKQSDGFGQLFLDDVQLSQVEECLFVERIQFRYMKIVGFRFGFCTGRFLYLSTEQYGVFIVRVLGEYGVDVFHSLLYCCIFVRASARSRRAR